MPSLQAALAFAEREHLPVGIRDYLDFDVPRRRHDLLDIDGAVGEGRRRLRCATRPCFVDLRRVVDGAHAATAAASQRLDHHAGAGRQVSKECMGGGQRGGPGRARHHWHAMLACQCAGACLVAEQPQHVGCRADEGQAGVEACLREIRVLGQEAIAGMDQLAARAASGAHHLLDIEVGARAAARQRHGFIGLAHVQRVAVVLAVHGHARHAQGRGRAGDADGDFATVGDQELGRIHVG